jgi:hypothetical protein
MAKAKTTNIENKKARKAIDFSEDITIASSVNAKKKLMDIGNKLIATKLEKSITDVDPDSVYSFELPVPKHPNKLHTDNRTIDYEMLKRMCIVQMSTHEISAYFGMSEINIDRKCVADLGLTFQEIKAMGLEVGKCNLRKAMYEAAVKDKNIQAMIWLSKNWLGMTDKQEVAITIKEWSTGWNEVADKAVEDIIDISSQQTALTPKDDENLNNDL